MTQKTTEVHDGDRVKVTSYGGSTDELYVGLEGVVSFSVERRRGQVYIVLLDKDPSPAMQAMLGGLPCYAHELEVINA